MRCLTGGRLMNIGLILSSILLNCLAQVLMRKGMLGVGVIDAVSGAAEKITAMAVNPWLWLALLSYGASLLIWLVVLSRVPVSFSSLGFVVVTACGWFFLGETVSVMRMAGVSIICLGVIIVSFSS